MHAKYQTENKKSLCIRNTKGWCFTESADVVDLLEARKYSCQVPLLNDEDVNAQDDMHTHCTSRREQDIY